MSILGIIALIFGALSARIEFSNAAGNRIVVSSSSNASLVIGSVPGNPATAPVFSLC